MGETIATVGELAGVCGHDGADWIKALIDAAGHLQIDIVDSGGADLKDLLDKLADILTELETKLETANLASDTTRYINAYTQGRIGGAWQKQPLAFGFSATTGEAKSNTNLSVGTNNLDGTAVPSGEIWVIGLVAIMYIGTSPTNIQVTVDPGGVNIPCLFELSPTSAKWYMIAGEFVLEEDQYIRGRCDGATAGDDLYFRYIGYRMDIDL